MDVCPTEEMPELNNHTDCNLQNSLVLGISSHRMHNLMRSLVFELIATKGNEALAVSEMISESQSVTATQRHSSQIHQQEKEGRCKTHGTASYCISVKFL